ncbi:MAG TPA: hypothetical protein VFN30_12735 [Chitinophagaceae bacterium]|nr:hypothetical protein [Chitinophagaceae bacterium]
MSDSQPVSKPPLITFLCSLVFVSSLYLIVQTFSGVFHSFGTLFSPFIVLCIIIAITGTSGMWAMEKWGFIVYTIAAIGFQIIPLLFGVWSFFWLAPVVLMFLFAFYIKEMK